MKNQEPAAVPGCPSEHTHPKTPRNTVPKPPHPTHPKPQKTVFNAQRTGVFGTQGPEVRILSLRPTISRAWPARAVRIGCSDERWRSPSRECSAETRFLPRTKKKPAVGADPDSWFFVCCRLGFVRRRAYRTEPSIIAAQAHPRTGAGFPTGSAKQVRNTRRLRGFERFGTGGHATAMPIVSGVRRGATTPRVLSSPRASPRLYPGPSRPPWAPAKRGRFMTPAPSTPSRRP